MEYSTKTVNKDNVINMHARPHFIVRSVLFSTMVISLIVWGIIGFLIYVPMLFRMVAYFCTMVFASTFQDIDIESVQKRLEYVVHLYPDKFKEIVESFQSRYSKDRSLPKSNPIDWKNLLKTAFLDIIWGIIFWLSIYYLFLKFAASL